MSKLIKSENTKNNSNSKNFNTLPNNIYNSQS